MAYLWPDMNAIFAGWDSSAIHLITFQNKIDMSVKINVYFARRSVL